MITGQETAGARADVTAPWYSLSIETDASIQNTTTAELQRADKHVYYTQSSVHNR